MYSTHSTKSSDIEHTWHLIDVKDVILGRIATKIVTLLSGKYKPNFVRHLDCGDNVVIINASHVSVTGKKEDNKIYTHYSGFPSGLKKTTLGQLRSTKPQEIIRRAVYGMLPNNKIRPKMMKRLFIFPSESHPYGAQFKHDRKIEQ